MRRLSSKQKTFIDKITKSGDIIGSYRKAYRAENMRESDVIREATEIMTKEAVEAELRQEISDGLRYRIVSRLDYIAFDKDVSPAVQVRALELLGKMTDVGLYRKAITNSELNPQSSQQLEDRLVARLSTLLATLVEDSETPDADTARTQGTDSEG